MVFPYEEFPNTNTLDSVSLSSKATYKLNLADSLPDLYFSPTNRDSFCLYPYIPNRVNVIHEVNICNEGESIRSSSQPFQITLYIFDSHPDTGTPLVIDSLKKSTQEWNNGDCIEYYFLVPIIGHPRLRYSYQYDHTYYYALNVDRNNGIWSFPEHRLEESDYSNNIDSFYVRALPNPVVLPKDTAICQGDTLKIELGAEYHSFLWSDSTTNDHLMVYDDGEYWVEARTNIKCLYKVRDSMEVSLLTVDYDKPSFEVDCERNTVVAELKPNDNLNFLWSNGSNESLTYFYSSDSIWIKVNDGICSVLDYLALPLLPDFNSFPRFSYDTVYSGALVEYNLDLDPIIWDAIWMPEDRIICDTCFNTQIHPSSSEEDIKLTLVHTSGCQYEFNFGLHWDKEGDLWMPNAFSPNGDGINDTWRVYQKDDEIIYYSGSIYDRWGNQIKSWTNESDISWDGMLHGKVMDSGVYLYWLQYAYSDGEIRTIFGDINLFR